MRELEPVKENVALPKRLSQTLLKHADRCPRSAYLYIKHTGGPGSPEKHRGTLFHIFAERLMVELVRRGERSLWDGEPDSSLTGAMMDAIVAEHPDLLVPVAEMDVARICAYHLALGLDVDPETVAGIERRFELDIAGVTVSGRIDLISFPDPMTLLIDDYKTTLGVLTEAAYSESFQGKLYALLVAFGRPTFWDPDTETWVREDPIGEHVRNFMTREIYPRPQLRPNGTLTQRARLLTRTELVEFRGDLERVIERVTAGVETGKWPALPGSWCTECPAEPECPLPRELRRFAGAISSHDEAAEALAWAERISDRVNATRAEVREFARHNGPIVVGDRIYDFETSHSRAVRKKKGRAVWDELEDAIARAARYGEPFDIDEWLRIDTRSTFKDRPLTREAAAHDDGTDDGAGRGARDERTAEQRAAELAERFGDEAPF